MWQSQVINRFWGFSSTCTYCAIIWYKYFHQLYKKTVYRRNEWNKMFTCKVEHTNQKGILQSPHIILLIWMHHVNLVHCTYTHSAIFLLLKTMIIIFYYYKYTLQYYKYWWSVCNLFICYPILENRYIFSTQIFVINEGIPNF